jgi:acyl-coenzyme A synthetase/AMP-(fatty) acid ligase
LPATPRWPTPYDFRSLRYIIAGAEPVKVETRRTYNEKFGLRILEGYGGDRRRRPYWPSTP